MMLAQETKAARVIGKTISTDFGIEDEGLIMGYLQNNIYSNKPKAICQEIMSNARDAHREIGTPNRPIAVKLPSRFNPTWECQDFGPGIAPDRVAKVFVRYGASTKRDDNTQTGGFGIGAKVPWAYADLFTIRTIAVEDGINIMRTYVAIKHGENGKPCLKEIGEPEETQEHTGTTIIIDIQPSEFAYFADYTTKVTQFWETRPDISCVDETLLTSYETYDWHYETANWKIGNKKGYYGESHACIDGIPYPINVNEFSDIGKNLTNILNTNCVMFFKVGELTVSLSRENLDYTKRTKAAIVNRLKEIQEFIDKEITDNIACAGNLWEANVLFNKLNAVFTVSNLTKGILWNGIEVSGEPIAINRGFNMRQYFFSDRTKSEKAYDIKPKENVILAYDDLGKTRPDTRRIATLHDKFPDAYIFCLIPPVDTVGTTIDTWKTENHWDDIKAGIHMLSNVEPKHIPRVKSAKPTSKNKFMKGVSTWDDTQDQWVPCLDADAATGSGIYIAKSGKYWNYNHDTPQHTRLLTFGVLSTTDKLYLIPSRYVNSCYEKTKLGAGWKRLSDIKKQAFHAFYQANSQAVKELEEKKTKDGSVDETFGYIGPMLRKHINKFQNKALRDWIQASIDIENDTESSEAVKLRGLAALAHEQLRIGVVASTVLNDLRDAVDDKVREFIDQSFDNGYNDLSYSKTNVDKVVACINAILP